MMDVSDSGRVRLCGMSRREDMMERIHPESSRQLEQLIKLHGPKAIQETLREIIKQQES